MVGWAYEYHLDSKGKGKEDAASRPLSQKATPKSKTRTATRWSKHTTEDDIEGLEMTCGQQGVYR